MTRRSDNQVHNCIHSEEYWCKVITLTQIIWGYSTHKILGRTDHTRTHIRMDVRTRATPSDWGHKMVDNLSSKQEKLMSKIYLSHIFGAQIQNLFPKSKSQWDDLY